MSAPTSQDGNAAAPSTSSSTSNNPLAQAQTTLNSTLSTMQQNMQQMAQRDLTLNNLTDKSENFVGAADNFARSSKQLQLKLQFKQYLIYFYIGLVFMDFVCYLILPGSYWTCTGALLAIGCFGYFAGKAYLSNVGPLVWIFGSADIYGPSEVAVEPRVPLIATD